MVVTQPTVGNVDWRSLAFMILGKKVKAVYCKPWWQKIEFLLLLVSSLINFNLHVETTAP